MKKLSIAVLVGVVALPVIALLYFTNSFPSLDLDHPACFWASPNTQAKNNCYVKEALEKNDGQYCTALEGEVETWIGTNLTAACYTELAVLNKDSFYCEKITGNYLSVVKPDCYTASAFAQNDPTVCDEYNDGSRGNAFCYSWFSYLRNDSSLCLNINNDYQRSDCLQRHETGYFSKDFYFCDRLVSPKTRNLCNQVGI